MGMGTVRLARRVHTGHRPGSIAPGVPRRIGGSPPVQRRPHPILPHGTRQTPHSRRVLPRAPSPTLLPQQFTLQQCSSSVPEQPSATRTVPDANPLPSEPPHPPSSSALDTLQGPRLQAALASLDPFSAEDVLLQPCNVFRSPPAVYKTQLRRAITVALQLIRDASGANPSSQTLASPALARAWKAWLFLPRSCSDLRSHPECRSSNCSPGSRHSSKVTGATCCAPPSMKLARSACTAVQPLMTLRGVLSVLPTSHAWGNCPQQGKPS